MQGRQELLAPGSRQVCRFAFACYPSLTPAPRRPTNNMMMRIVATLAVIAVASAHTQEEIEKKGKEIMEERRVQHGHWMQVSTPETYDFIVDHLGVSCSSCAGDVLSRATLTILLRDLRPAGKRRCNRRLFLGRGDLQQGRCSQAESGGEGSLVPALRKTRKGSGVASLRR